MRALVTGGAGFIGSNLVDRLLAEGHSVDVVDNLSSGKLANLADARANRDNEFTFHQIDVCDPAVSELIERRRPEVVFHLAAQIDVRVSVSDPALDARINVIGSINVLEGARRAGTRKVVFASSGGTIYGDVDAEDLPVTEAHPQQPVSPYGISKKVGHGLPLRLPGAAPARVHLAGPGQRVRAPPGPPRRGRRGGHLRRTAAVR